MVMVGVVVACGVFSAEDARVEVAATTDKNERGLTIVSLKVIQEV